MGLRYLLAIILAELAFGSAVWGQPPASELAQLRTQICELERQNGELRTALEPPAVRPGAAAAPAAEIASRGGGLFGEWGWVAGLGLLVVLLNRRSAAKHLLRSTHVSPHGWRTTAR